MQKQTKFYEVENYRYVDLVRELLDIKMDNVDWNQHISNILDLHAKFPVNKKDSDEPIFYCAKIKNEQIYHIDEVLFVNNEPVYDWPEIYIPRFYEPHMSYSLWMIHLFSNMDYASPKIQQYIKENFSVFIDKLTKIPGIFEANFHFLSAGCLQGEHVDQQDKPPYIETERTNIIVSLTDSPNVNFLVGGEEIPMKKGQLLAFNAQYPHGATVLGDKEWICLVLHLPTKDFYPTIC